MVIPRSDGAELMDGWTDELKSLPASILNSSLLLSRHLQQIGSMEWIMYKPSLGAFYNALLRKHLHKLNVNTVVVVVYGCNFLPTHMS
jgi:hypothetical protein